jgi:hypothetical protein
MELRIPARFSDRIVSLFNWAQTVDPNIAAEMSGVIKQAKHGLEITIVPLEFHHTREQVGYYRKWCREFGNYCGMTPDEMHEEMLCQAYGSEEVTTKFGTVRRPLQRSGDVKRGDYSVLIDTLIRVAAEMGFDVPPPQRKIT